MNQVVHPAILVDYLPGEGFQHGLIGQISHKIVVGQHVDDAYPGAGGLKLLRYDLADARGPAGYHGNSIVKHGPSSFLFRFLFQSFNEKTHGPETVVAGNHGGSGILHPSVV